MQKFFSKFPDAFIRIGLLFAGLVALIIIIRGLLPPEIKKTEIHKKSTVDREIAKPINYAGSNVCGNCHEESNIKSTGYHRNLSCETCHGAAKEHSENPSDVKPQIPRQREFCTHCHNYDMSRPTGFPQINPIAHNPLKPCVTCHNPHDPKPPTTPQECQACHAEIARTKAISYHVMVECTTCHRVKVEHKLAPQIIKATIPSDKIFCARCHSKELSTKGISNIDFTSHYEKYMCWQCHDPHNPEIE